MAGGVLPSGSCLDFPPWWTMEASEPFLPCAALGREYFITATESKQGISTFGWLLEDGEGGGGQLLDDPEGEDRRLWGEHVQSPQG